LLHSPFQSQFESIAQILGPFHEIMSDVQSYELWNEKYRKHDGRSVCLSCLGKISTGDEVEEIAPGKGRRRSCAQILKGPEAVTRSGRRASEYCGYDDDDSGDCDYVPTQTCRHR
jgi:hypothetical protein